MAGLDDFRKQAEQVLSNDKVRDALHSDKAEDASDRVLDGVEGAADHATGGRFDAQSDDRDRADDRIGVGTEDERGASHTGIRDADIDRNEGRDTGA